MYLKLQTNQQPHTQARHTLDELDLNPLTVKPGKLELHFLAISLPRP